VTLGTVPNVDRAVAPEPPPAPKPAKLDTLGRVRSPGRPPGSKNKPKPPHGTNDNAMRTSTPKTPPKPIETLDERGRTAIIDIRGVAVEDWNAFGQIAFNEGKHPPTKVAEMITDYVSSGTVGGIPHKVLKAKLTPIIDELETFARQKPGTISNGSVSHTAARIRNLLKEWREAGASASATPERSAKSTVAGMKGSLNNV
jgi:hypothetical protein